MKHYYLTICLMFTSFATPLAWGDCSSMEEYREIIAELNQDISVLEKEKKAILSEDDRALQVYEIMADNPMSGSKLLHEKEHWKEIVEKVEAEKKTTALRGSVPAAGLAIMSGINYYLYKNPLSTKPVFSDQLLRPINGNILARIFGGVFFAWFYYQTAWYGHRYFYFIKEADIAQLKIETLGRLADVEDHITSKKRMLDHFEIEANLLSQSCSSP